MPHKNVTVTLLGIKNTHTGSDPGTDLEIYGDLHAMQVGINPDTGDAFAIKTVPLFHRNDDNAVVISEGATFGIGATTDLQIHPGEFLWVGGHMAEQDDIGPNDNLGFSDDKISYNNLDSGPVQKPFSDGDEAVQVNFSLSVEEV